MPELGRGDRLPELLTAVPGPRSSALAADLAAHEAPGLNTLVGGAPSLVWQAARGANVLDVDGNRYVDFTSGFGVAAVGHAHPRVVAAVRRQAGELLHGLGDVHAHPRRLELAARLTALAPLDRPQVYFAVSGADAVEIALGTALLATGRVGIVAFAPGYHGLTLGARAVCARDAFRVPFGPHLHPHVVHLPFGCPPAAVAATLARAPIGAVLVEPIVGREGVVLPPAGWLAALAGLCRESGALFIADEIFTGFGRSGALFVVDAEGVRPDLLCCGKALGGGLPIAAVLGRRELFSAWDRPGEALHTATFVAHPLACAAALATLDLLDDYRLVGRAAALGAKVEATLAPWPTRFPGIVTDVRGRGLLWGVELADAALAARLVAAARALGVLVLAGGPEGRVAQLAPPLVITRRQLDDGLARLALALTALAARG